MEKELSIIQNADGKIYRRGSRAVKYSHNGCPPIMVSTPGWYEDGDTYGIHGIHSQKDMEFMKLTAERVKAENENNRPMVTKKTWEEFNKTGLITLVNNFLFIFGWALMIQPIDNSESSGYTVYPARVRYKTIDPKKMCDAYKDITKYMRDNITELARDVDIQ